MSWDTTASASGREQVWQTIPTGQIERVALPITQSIAVGVFLSKEHFICAARNQRKAARQGDNLGFLNSMVPRRGLEPPRHC